jgi:hypothetical protein
LRHGLDLDGRVKTLKKLRILLFSLRNNKPIARNQRICNLDMGEVEAAATKDLETFFFKLLSEVFCLCRPVV